MIRLVTSVLVAVAAVSSAVIAHTHKKGGLEVVHPWVSATATQEVASVPVYMTIKNRSGTTDRLQSASTEIAARVRMNAANPAAEAFAIPAGGSLELKRGGSHLVLEGVGRRLDAYQDFKLTLVFEKAGRMEVDVMVEEAADVHTH